MTVNGQLFSFGGKRPTDPLRSWARAVIAYIVTINSKRLEFIKSRVKTMRQIPILIGTLGMFIVGMAVPVAAQPARDQGPCEQITAACQGVGFTQGGVHTGSGLLADCIVPIMQGKAQPRQARNPLPQLDPQLVAACKANNPRFGQGSGPPSEAPAQLLPASPPSPSATIRNPQPQASAAGTGRRCASTHDSMPRGLTVVLALGDDRPRADVVRAIANPSISGVAVQINWRDIEPDEGKPDWSKLDALFAAAEASNKWVHLSIFPGFFSPAWALEGVQTDQFEIQYGPGHGALASLPMPWNRVYLDRWFAFVKLLSDRYGASPALRMIAAAGPTSVSEEMTLPQSPPAVRKWLKDSYTPEKYLAAWKETFKVYAAIFPNQCISLAGPNLPTLGQGRIDPVERMREKQNIVEQARRAFGRRLAVQSNDLHAGHAPVEAPDNTDFINSYSGRIITGFETRGSSQGPGPSQIMGAEGDPPLALQRSIDKGMALNNAGQHVDYLEIHIGDVLPADMQPVLQHAASMFREPRP